MAPDPERAIYAKFANAGIPRNYHWEIGKHLPTKEHQQAIADLLVDQKSEHEGVALDSLSDSFGKRTEGAIKN